jgi:hypothetical protein
LTPGHVIAELGRAAGQLLLQDFVKVFKKVGALFNKRFIVFHDVEFADDLALSRYEQW